MEAISKKVSKYLEALEDRKLTTEEFEIIVYGFRGRFKAADNLRACYDRGFTIVKEEGGKKFHQLSPHGQRTLNEHRGKIR